MAQIYQRLAALVLLLAPWSWWWLPGPYLCHAATADLGEFIAQLSSARREQPLPLLRTLTFRGSAHFHLHTNGALSSVNVNVP